MSLTQFLNWIYGLRDRVTWLIQDAWTDVKNVVNNAWNWAVQRAVWAYNSATAYAYQIVNDLHITLNDTFQLLAGWISDARDYAYQTASYFAAGARDFASGLFNSVLSTAYNLYNSARSYAQGLINQLDAALRPLIDAARQAALDLVAPIVDWYNGVKATVLSVVDWFTHEWPAWRDTIANLVTTFSAANLAKFLDFVNRLYDQVVAFFDDPLGVIIAYLEPIVLEWLSELLGYAFKGDGQELPPKTIFRSH